MSFMYESTEVLLEFIVVTITKSFVHTYIAKELQGSWAIVPKRWHVATVSLKLLKCWHIAIATIANHAQPCIQCSIITALCVWMVPSTLSWLVDTAYAYDVRAGKCHYYVFILASMAGTLYWLHNITSVYIIVSSKTFHAT